MPRSLLGSSSSHAHQETTPKPSNVSDQPSVTKLLHRVANGDTAAEKALFPLVKNELYRIAKRHMADQGADHTLQATALVDQAFMQLCRAEQGWSDRSHFAKVAARAMRHILVDHARAKGRQRRKAPGERLGLDHLVEALETRAGDPVGLHEALQELEACEPHLVRLVELRFFGGYSMPEVAELLERPLRTVERDWTFTKAWLRKELDA